MNYGYQGPHVNNFGHPPHSSNVVSPGSGISNPPHPLNSAIHQSSNSPSHRYPTPFMQPNGPTNPNKPGDSNVLPSQLGLRAAQNMPAGPQSGVKGPISPVSPTAQNPTIYHQPSPTIFPCYGFDPKKDAQALRKAMKGFGTDERTLIEILTKRMRPQREEIALHYKTIFNRDLVKDIKSDTSGNFKKLLVALMTPLPQYYASELYGAMAGLGTRESVLFQILCTVSNHEMRLINDEYRSMYEKSLQTDISADTSSHLKRLLIALTHGTRDESSHLNPAAALEDAKELQQAGELRVGTDEFVFHQIFVSRNRPQLQLVFNSYQELTGHSIEKILMKEFTGDLRDALLAIAKSTQDPTGFFAEELYKSLKGKNDSSLIRLIVTHCELDLGEIKCKFHSKYSKYLRDMVSNECSGDYKKALLSLIG